MYSTVPLRLCGSNSDKGQDVIHHERDSTLTRKVNKVSKMVRSKDSLEPFLEVVDMIYLFSPSKGASLYGRVEGSIGYSSIHLWRKARHRIL